MTEVATTASVWCLSRFPPSSTSCPRSTLPLPLCVLLVTGDSGLRFQISVVECCVAGVQEKFDVTRTKGVWVVGGTMALISLVFTTHGGLFVLDAADYFINNFGAVTAGLLEVVLVAWVLRRVDELRTHANAVSGVRIGLWWKVSLTVVTPLFLGYMLVERQK